MSFLGVGDGGGCCGVGLRCGRGGVGMGWKDPRPHSRCFLACLLHACCILAACLLAACLLQACCRLDAGLLQACCVLDACFMFARCVLDLCLMLACA